MDNIFTRIQKLILALNIKQINFTRDLGYSHAAFNKWKNGGRISESSLKLIERTYNVNPSWLRTGEGEMFLENKLPEHSANEAESSKADSRDALIIAALRMATDEQKDFILKYIKEQNELAAFREKARKNKKLG